MAADGRNGGNIDDRSNEIVDELGEGARSNPVDETAVRSTQPHNARNQEPRYVA